MNLSLFANTENSYRTHCSSCVRRLILCNPLQHGHISASQVFKHCLCLQRRGGVDGAGGGGSVDGGSGGSGGEGSFGNDGGVGCVFVGRAVVFHGVGIGR